MFSVTDDDLTVSFGAYVHKGSVIVPQETLKLHVLVKRLNDLASYYAPDFKWNSIKLYGSGEHDLGTVKATNGISMVMMFGDYHQGAFTVKANSFSVSKPGSIAFFNPIKHHVLQKAKGQRFCVVFHQIPAAALLPEDAKIRLHNLGFGSETVFVQREKGDSTSSTTAKAGPSTGQGDDDESDFDDAASLYSDTGITDEQAAVICRRPTPSWSLSPAESGAKSESAACPAEPLSKKEKIALRDAEDMPYLR